MALTLENISLSYVLTHALANNIGHMTEQKTQLLKQSPRDIGITCQEFVSRLGESAESFHLNLSKSEEKLLTRTVWVYSPSKSCSSGFVKLVLKILNAIKSIYGQSDWQRSCKLLQSKYVTVKTCLKKGLERSLIQIRAEINDDANIEKMHKDIAENDPNYPSDELEREIYTKNILVPKKKGLKVQCTLVESLINQIFNNALPNTEKKSKAKIAKFFLSRAIDYYSNGAKKVLKSLNMQNQLVAKVVNVHSITKLRFQSVSNKTTFQG